MEWTRDPFKRHSSLDWPATLDGGMEMAPLRVFDPAQSCGAFVGQISIITFVDEDTQPANFDDPIPVPTRDQGCRGVLGRSLQRHALGNVTVLALSLHGVELVLDGSSSLRQLPERTR